MGSQSHGAFERRLEDEGRLQEFKDRFRAIRAELKAGGVEGAGSKAWSRAKIEFSDPAPVQDTAEAADMDVFEGRMSPPPEAIAWVARNLEVKDVQPSQAPGPEAWSLYVWARRPGNADVFWQRLYVTTMPTRAAMEARAGLKDDGRQIKLIDMVIRAARVAKKKALLEDEALIAEVKAEIEARLKSPEP